MPITIYPGSMKKRNANGSYSDLVPAIGTDPEVLDDFAEEYDPTATYNIGDYCIHNSDFYKCNTNNTTGTWNNNAWDRVSVADELADHKNTLNHLENGLAIIVDGNSCASGASQGQYVYLKDSTIAGYADGLYTAAQAIPANTAIDGTYLTAVSGGGLNSLQNAISGIQLIRHSISLGGISVAAGQFAARKSFTPNAGASIVGVCGSDLSRLQNIVYAGVHIDMSTTEIVVNGYNATGAASAINGTIVVLEAKGVTITN